MTSKKTFKKQWTLQDCVKKKVSQPAVSAQSEWRHGIMLNQRTWGIKVTLNVGEGKGTLPGVFKYFCTLGFLNCLNNLSFDSELTDIYSLNCFRSAHNIRLKQPQDWMSKRRKHIRPICSLIIWSDDLIPCRDFFRVWFNFCLTVLWKAFFRTKRSKCSEDTKYMWTYD